MMSSYEMPTRSWQVALEMIAETPIGAKVLQKVNLLCEKGKLVLQDYPHELKSQLVAAQTPNCPIGAVFITDGECGQIYCDLETELGVFVPFLFHEMIHSLDTRLWSAARQRLSQSARNQLIYSSECLAFSVQFKFLEELKKLNEGLANFYQQRYPHLAFLNRALSPREILELYSFLR